VNPIESFEQVAGVLAGFDFRIDSEDFILYELARMIEEDRATFEDEEFRRLIDEGIRQHVEEVPAIRQELAEIVRQALPGIVPGARVVAQRVIRTLDDLHMELRSVAVIVHSYTAYLFQRLENVEDSSHDEESAAAAIQRWRNGEIPRETLVSELQRLGRPAVAPAADLLFEGPDDFRTADPAVEILAAIASPASARVLAHAVSEPIMPEYLEGKALDALREMWSLAKPYVLYNLRNHSHEDLPYRWFELLVETGEPSVVDLIIEELRVHGANPAYQEDLTALVELLNRSRDPELQDKILSVLNAENTPTAVTRLLEDFFRSH
jgi:hypothetical protein